MYAYIFVDVVKRGELTLVGETRRYMHRIRNDRCYDTRVSRTHDPCACLKADESKQYTEPRGWGWRGGGGGGTSTQTHAHARAHSHTRRQRERETDRPTDKQAGRQRQTQTVRISDCCNRLLSVSPEVGMLGLAALWSNAPVRSRQTVG